MIEVAAQHEAGHAVMRWLCGLQATGLIAREDGSGFCHGTGRRRTWERALTMRTTVKQAIEGLATVSPKAMVICPTVKGVWHLLSTSVKARARRSLCAGRCGFEVVWDTTVSPDEPVKMCRMCARLWIDRLCVRRRVDGSIRPIVVLDLQPGNER